MKMMMKKGKWELLAVQMDLRLYSNDDSIVYDVECEASLVAFTDLKKTP